jgi:hypothetical protein
MNCTGRVPNARIVIVGHGVDVRTVGDLHEAPNP